MNVHRYDERIWKEISPRVESRTGEILVNVQGQIAEDRSLDRLPSKHQIIQQRADSWVQQLYEVCCEVYKNLGREITDDFDRVVWVYCIEPFILKEVEATTDLSKPGLLELLLCAVGSPPHKNLPRRARYNSWCVAVRAHIFEAWQKRLLHLQGPTRLEEAAASMAAFNTRERRARQIVAGLVPQSEPVAQTSPGGSQTPSVATPSLKATTTDAPESGPGPQISSGSSQTLPEQTPSPKGTTKTDTGKSYSVPKEKNLPLPAKQHDYSNLMDPAPLTDLQRQCFSLRHEYQLPVTEIARRLGRDRTTIQEHIDSAETKIKISVSKDRARKRLARFNTE